MGTADGVSLHSSDEFEMTLSWLEPIFRHELLLFVALEDPETDFSLDDDCECVSSVISLAVRRVFSDVGVFDSLVMSSVSSSPSVPAVEEPSDFVA